MGSQPIANQPEEVQQNVKAEVDQIERSSDGNNSVHGFNVRQKSYLKSLAFCPEVDRTVSLRKTFLRPFVLMTYPTVIWSSLIYGLSLGWNVVLGASIAQLFAPP
jgi:hypothetical protein